VSFRTVRDACACLALVVAVGSCAADFDDVGADAAPSAESTGDDGLWTRVKTPPYDVAARSRARRVLDLEPDATGDITLVTELRWRDHSSGAVNPQVRVALMSGAGESTLLQIFESGGALRTRVDLAMTDALEVGAWYRVMLTIADAPGRPLQVRIFDEDEVEVWRSCDGAAARCPSVQIAAEDLDTLRLNVIVDDARDGEGHVELSNTSLLRNP
jgi:hypothetical protein